MSLAAFIGQNQNNIELDKIQKSSEVYKVIAQKTSELFILYKIIFPHRLHF